jgi:hypothetical protein
MNKFEQLIEYVINDEEHKARELFHDIVVEKSRQIYEDIMAEESQEDLDEAEDIEEGQEELDEADELDEDLMDQVDTEEASDMSMEDDDSLGGDEQDNFIDNVEANNDKDMGDMDSTEGSDEPATKDDILNLEDKLDQLMADFENLMGDTEGGDGDGFGPDEGGDAIEMDDTGEMTPGMMEAVSLKAAPKPVTGEQGAYAKSPVAANAGAKGPIGSTVKPVHAGGEMGGHHDTAAYRNTTKDLIGKVGNTPAQGTQKPSAATKPHLGQAAGVNTKSVVPGKHN